MLGFGFNLWIGQSGGAASEPLAPGAPGISAIPGGPGEIIFDPIAPQDRWMALSGGPGEIIFEEAA